MHPLLTTVTFHLVTLTIPLCSLCQTGDQMDLREQLRLAHQEGLPATADEFNALLPSVTPANNAAPMYKAMLTPLVLQNTKQLNLAKILGRVSTNASELNISKARAALTGCRELLELADQAAKHPLCNFKRDWWLGPSVLLPEVASMKQASHAVLLRGTFAAVQGRTEDAIANAREALTFAKHAADEPTMIGLVVREQIYVTALRIVLRWSANYPRDSAYRVLAREMVAAYPSLDLRAEHRLDLLNLLSLIKHAETASGREELGLKEPSWPFSDGANYLLKHQSADKLLAVAVKAVRTKYRCLSDNPLNPAKISAANDQLLFALAPYPTAAYNYFVAQLDMDDPIVRTKEYDARRQKLVSLIGPVMAQGD
jgi:hypothetical protein